MLTSTRDSARIQTTTLTRVAGQAAEDRRIDRDALDERPGVAES